jgi:DNA polymerase-3 subunit beta
VDCKRLLDVCRNSKDVEVVISREPDEYSVSVNGTVLMGHDPEDWPMCPEIEPDPERHGWYGDCDHLREGLEAVAVAASKDAFRQQLMGVAWCKGRLVASDGKRLAEYRLTHDREENNDDGIVPIGAVKAMVKLLKLDKGRLACLRVRQDTIQAELTTASGRVFCRLLEGQMPDYLSLIPSEFSTEVTGPAKDIMDAVKAVGVVLSKDNQVVTLDANGAIIVRGAGADTGSAQEEIPSAHKSGADVAPHFAVNFLVDGLKACSRLGDGTADIGLQRDRGAAVMFGGRRSVSGGLYRYAFMPVIPHGPGK